MHTALYTSAQPFCIWFALIGGFGTEALYKLDHAFFFNWSNYTEQQ